MLPKICRLPEAAVGHRLAQRPHQDSSLAGLEWRSGPAVGARTCRPGSLTSGIGGNPARLEPVEP